MSELHRSNRREVLLSAAGLGVLGAAGVAASAAEDKKEPPPDKVAERDEKIERFAAPGGKAAAAKKGEAQSAAVASVISVASHTFSFNRPDGQAEEKTVAVNRPSGAGFIVMLQDLYYAFVNAHNGTTLRERPLGQFVVDIGMRGNNLVCRVRLTDSNSDDPVSIHVSAAVLFFT